MIMKKKILAFILFASACLLAGCGNTEKLEAYYDGMMTFNGNVQIITETIDLIDVDRDSAPDMVCDQLDKLVEQFRIMSELEVPKNFAGCEELGDDAYEYMVEATRLYKEWAEDPDYEDDQLVSMAQQNYDRAMKRVNYMSVILQGGTPEGEGVTILEEDATDFAPIMDEEDADDYSEE